MGGRSHGRALAVRAGAPETAPALARGDRQPAGHSAAGVDSSGTCLAQRRRTEGRSPAQGKQHDGWTKLRKRRRSDEPRTLAPCVGVQRRVIWPFRQRGQG